MFTLYICDFFFFNTARASDKSYMINHVVYFGLNEDDFSITIMIATNSTNWVSLSQGKE